MERKVKYVVSLHKVPETDYGVASPDLPGCFSLGETIKETLVNTTKRLNAI